MGKLWQKDYDLDKTIERFTVGDDVELDLELAEFDVLGSIAHARMLARIGILTKTELKKLQRELVKILGMAERGEFTIRREQEDVHTAVEEMLTAALGEPGKKIHTARSRNDQVALDCRLYARARLLELRGELIALARRFLAFAERHADVPMVGRTHTQRAMPSSVGLWASAFAEALIDDVELLRRRLRLVNRSPLGLRRELRRRPAHRPRVHRRAARVRASDHQRALREQHARKVEADGPERLRGAHERPRQGWRPTSSSSASRSSGTSSCPSEFCGGSSHHAAEEEPGAARAHPRARPPPSPATS